MRSTTTVILLATIAAATGCGATRAQRRTNATLAVAAGAAIVGIGLIVAQGENDDDCPGDEICLLDVNENAVLAGLLVVGGGGLAFGGITALVGSALESRRTEPPPAPAGDPEACVEWRRQLDVERDPARRGALHAIRPPHCAPVLAPDGGAR